MRGKLLGMFGAGLVAIAVASCAGGAGWSKSGATAEDTQRDLADCRRQAEAQAERETFGRAGAPAPVIEVDPATGRMREGFAAERRSAGLRETARAEELFRACMEQRGYQRTR